MTDSASDLAGFEQRVRRVEQQLATYKLIALLLLVIVLGYWVVKGVTDVPVTVKKILLESQEVKLVDPEGNTRFFMRLYSKVPILQLIDNNGKPRMSLGLRFDETPFIDLSDKNGETRAVFEMTPDDEPTLRMLDRAGNTTFKIN